MITRIFIALIASGLLCGSIAVTAFGAEGNPEVTTLVKGKVVVRSEYGVDAFYFAGDRYSVLSQTPVEIRVKVDALFVGKEVRIPLNGYFANAIKLTPTSTGTEVTISKSPSARGFAVAVSPSSSFVPDSGNVVLTLSYGHGSERGESEKGSGSGDNGNETNGARTVSTNKEYPRLRLVPEEEGRYQLPPFPYKYKYSDALVSLSLVNTDFRDVLMLLSEIGNVSIVLDPYWEDEPTGGRRRPGGPGGLGGGGGDGGGGEGGGGDGGGGQSGFREASIFQARLPRSGTGNLTLNLENVPFDLALDLVLTAVNLEKIDVYPGFFDAPQAGQDKPEPNA